jgi:hypothetical protein
MFVSPAAIDHCSIPTSHIIDAMQADQSAQHERVK